MNITEYLKKINDESQVIFSESVKETNSFGKCHHIASCVYEFSEFIFDPHEKGMLATVSAQLEAASVNVALGLYRQAFSSLRLALEMGLGVAHFSVHKLEHYEWLNGTTDIKWFKIIDPDNGVLSKRFATAFFSELIIHVEQFNLTASEVYRELSEFVHGNNETWVKSGIVIKFSKALLDQYFKFFDKVSNVILFVLCCRYLKALSPEEIESMEFISQEFNYIAPIRELFGGPKEIK